MVCPVCTIAIVAGVGILRAWGVDDVISGLWVGGLLLSSSLWLVDWLRRKKRGFKNDEATVTLLMYAIALVPLYFMGMVGDPNNRIFGQDKLAVGIVAGSIVFILGVGFDKHLRRLNNGKVLFFYQKVILPISFLIAASLAAYLIMLIMY